MARRRNARKPDELKPAIPIIIPKSPRAPAKITYKSRIIDTVSLIDDTTKAEMAAIATTITIGHL